MGMYTELNIGVNLNKYTPERIINIIKYMLQDIEEVEVTKHLLFSTDRWKYMLISDSYYFDGRTDSSIIKDNISKEYELNVRCNLKNYDNEIYLFLNFIQPYLSTDGFIGYTRYEEADDPTLIYNTFEGIKLVKIGDFGDIQTLNDEWLRKQKCSFDK